MHKEPENRNGIGMDVMMMKRLHELKRNRRKGLRVFSLADVRFGVSGFQDIKKKLHRGLKSYIRSFTEL